MMPALVVGDHVFVSKSAYGYSRYSLPFDLPLFDGRIAGVEPLRGDIVVFRMPSDPDVDMVKRVVGLPGETVQMIGGVLHIDGAPMKLEPMGVYHGAEVPAAGAALQREMHPNGTSYDVISLTEGGLMDDTRIFEVPPGHYFMMGDNRDNSADSRFIGFVPYANLVGKVEWIYWNSAGDDYSSRQP